MSSNKAPRHPLKWVKNRVRRALVACGGASLLARKLHKELRQFSPGKDGSPTLLALKPERFRGDLEILGGVYGFRIVAFKKGWQQKLLEFYWGDDIDFGSYYQPAPGSSTERMQRNLRRFLRKVLSRFHARAGIDAVIGAATYYMDDYDIGKVSSDLGVPYIVLYRECFLANERECGIQREICATIGRFPGHHVLVHNTILRDLLIESGFVAPDKVTAAGCMRMDDYLERVRKYLAERQAGQAPAPKTGQKLVTLFSFVHCTGIPHVCNSFTPARDAGFVELFDHTHGRIAKLAAEHPEVRFVIKPKWGNEQWLGEIGVALGKYGLKASELPNLEILPDANAQDLILESQVVLGFGSTTLAEAAVAGKQVVIPYFAEAALPENDDNVLLKDDFDAFDVARSPEELETLVLQRLEEPTVPEETMARRREVFERYVSPVAGGASDTYARTIRRIIEQSRTT